MTNYLLGTRILRGTLWIGGNIRSDVDRLRIFVLIAAFGWAVAFVVIGLHYELQMYGDGSIFSYSVAVRDAWAFHWHNISGRLFAYAYSYVPAENYVAWTGDARGGIVVYGTSHFLAPLLGLLGTFAADRSRSRILFVGACFSTVCLCPLVFGFPTEMWMAHALFWPTLAVCHYARSGLCGLAVVFAAMLALIFTHAGALIFALAILATLALRGWWNVAFVRAARVLIVAIIIAALVRLAIPPDAYFAPVLQRAALHVFDLTVCTSRLFLLLITTLTTYGVVLLVLRRGNPTRAHVYATAVVALGLVAYWFFFNRGIHADKRYYMRTLLIICTPIFGALAAWYAVVADDEAIVRIPLLTRLTTAIEDSMTVRAVGGALALVILVHAVETAKFVAAWSDYKVAIQALATGANSDPSLGDQRFVSAARITDTRLNRLAWNSTTPYLSVLLAPRFTPARLVVDPAGSYFWLSCQTAIANEEAARALPVEGRGLCAGVCVFAPLNSRRCGARTKVSFGSEAQ